MMDIFGLVFAKRKQEVDAIHDSYHSMLVRMAQREELDLDEVRTLTIDAGKSQEECSRDLEAMEKRIAMAAERKNWLNIQGTLPGLQTKYAEIKAEMDAMIAKLQPQLIQLEWQINAASDAGAQCIRINNDLNSTCLNRALVEREQEVGSQRQALMQKRGPLFDDLQKTKQLESYLRSRCENPKGSPSSEQRELQARRDDVVETIDQLERAIWAIDAEVEPYDAELADIGRQKLQP